MFKRIVEFLASPGAKGSIENAAPTQHVFHGDKPEGASGRVVPIQNVTGYIRRTKKGRLDRWLDKIVQASGSKFTFLFIICGLLCWALLGMKYGKGEQWAALISDIQAIVSYIFDSLLMRQQLNGYESQIHASASLRSRVLNQKKMLRQALATGRYKRGLPDNALSSLPSGLSLNLPTENWVGRATNYFAAILGHFSTVCLYWICIFIWIGFGHYCNWSPEWQLYINSATSALMILIFAFLANIRERHEVYIEECLDTIFHVDSAIEKRLRIVTCDDTPNPTVVVPGPRMGRLQRAVFYYSDVIGTLVGVSILLAAIAAWVAIGPVMKWDDNWWLLIGTYAGLVGLIDGFVLRNVQHQLHEYEEIALKAIRLDDVGILEEIGELVLERTDTDDLGTNSLNYRLSAAMGIVCAHEITVLLGIVLVVGLIVAASAMKWTTSGQLVCNIPPSIIESFFMMILITGHNISEARRRADLNSMYMGRLKLLSFVNQLDEATEPKGSIYKKSIVMPEECVLAVA
ncbi:putative low affinity iron transporter [Mariannaea sp. PMI_226]|nr:putative low affinity iron transporter [Mariannaea sp. PMI_226]